MLPEFSFAEVLLERSGLRGEGVRVVGKGVGEPEELLGSANAGGAVYTCVGGARACNGNDCA